VGRPSSPWWKESHGAWYCRIDKRLVRLATTRPEAMRAFHRLMADRGSGGRVGDSSRTLGWLADLWLDDVKDRVKPRTWSSYRDHAQSIINAIGKVPLSDLEPRHVALWLRSHPTWGKSTRNLATSIAKMIMRWGVSEGRLTGMTADPWSTVKRPPMQARAPAKPIELSRLVEGILSEEFREFVALAVETGCRPGELRALEARRIDWKSRKAVVTGKRGERTVFLSPVAVAILRRWAKRYPDGPVMRNTRGEPWSERAIQDQFQRAGERVGVHVVPYHTRGIFASLALRRGVDAVLVAKLMGHTDVKMLMKHYADVEDAQLSAAVNQATARPDASVAAKTPKPSRPGKTPGKRRHPRT
jgi:integrase/recombinase XerC